MTQAWAPETITWFDEGALRWKISRQSWITDMSRPLSMAKAQRSRWKAGRDERSPWARCRQGGQEWSEMKKTAWDYCCPCRVCEGMQIQRDLGPAIAEARGQR
jgi:hypothetical protein